MYCAYYQAKAVRNKIWFIAGCIRNEYHWAFDRAVEGKENILEFFVAPDFEEDFLSLMTYLKEESYILELEKLPNRIEKEGQV